MKRDDTLCKLINCPHREETRYEKRYVCGKICLTMLCLHPNNVACVGVPDIPLKRNQACRRCIAMTAIPDDCPFTTELAVCQGVK